MDRTLHFGDLSGRHFGGFGCLILLLAMCTFASCHTPQSKKNRIQPAHLSPQDSLLGEQFPFDAYFQVQKELLLKHSKPTKKGIVPDGKSFEGNFSNGTIDLIFDEIDGEPNNFYGHLAEPNPQKQMEFIIFGIPDETLEKLVPGQKFRVYWIETVVNTAPFDDDRYRDFLTYRVEGL